MPVRSSGNASFSDSIPPLYEHGSAPSTWDAPLSQTELQSHSRNCVLAQEEIGFQSRHNGGTSMRSIAKNSLRSSRNRPQGDQAQTLRRPTPTSRPSRDRTPQREKLHTTHRTPQLARLNSPSAQRATRKERVKLVKRGTQSADHTDQTSPRRRRHAGSVEVEHFEREPGHGEVDDEDDEHVLQDESDEEYDGSQLHSGEAESLNGEDHSEELSSEDEDGSGEADDSEEENGNRRRAGLIPKPDGEVSRPGRGGYTLSTSLGWSRADYTRLTKVVKKYVNQTLDLDLTFGEQEIESIDLVCELVIKKLPILSEYEDAWPIKDVIRCQLKYQRSKHLLSKIRADAELARRFKKVKRG